VSNRSCLQFLLVGCFLVWSATGSSVAEGESAVDRSVLVEVPHPLVDNFEATVQERLVEERAAFDRLIERDLLAEELAEAYGRLGQLYYVHDLPQVALTSFGNALRLQGEDSRWHYFVGVIHADAGELEAATESFERVLSAEPENLPARIRLARAQLDMGGLDAAEQSFGDILARDPVNATAEYGLGQVAFERGEFDAAIEHFENALAQQPTATRIHYLLGMAYREKGDREAAIEHLQQNRDDPVLFDDPLIDELFLLVESAKLHFDSGLQLLVEGNLELAIVQFRIAVEKNQENFLYHYNLGSALVAADLEEEGIEEFRRTIELNPSFRDGHFNLAATLARRGQYDEAAKHFELAHDLDPDDPLPHLEWATALERTGQPERTAEELAKLLELNPGYPQALLNLGTVRAQLGRLEEATEPLELLLSSDAAAPVLAEGHFRLAKISEQMGDDLQAIEHYRSALELDFTVLEATVALGQSLGRAGRFEEAAPYFHQATLLDPDDLGSHFGHALSLILAGRHSQARTELEKSHQLHPESIPLTHLLARLLATAPEAEVRDGDQALVLAQETFSQEPSLEHAETLAMAYAELGRFEEAVDLQDRVIAEAQRYGGAPFQEMLDRLELYRNGEPCRTPWQDR